MLRLQSGHLGVFLNYLCPEQNIFDVKKKLASAIKRVKCSGNRLASGSTQSSPHEPQE